MISQFDKFVATYIAAFGNPSPGQVNYEDRTIILRMSEAAAIDGNPKFDSFKLETVGSPFEDKDLSPFPVEKYHLVQ